MIGQVSGGVNFSLKLAFVSIHTIFSSLLMNTTECNPWIPLHLCDSSHQAQQNPNKKSAMGGSGILARYNSMLFFNTPLSVTIKNTFALQKLDTTFLIGSKLIPWKLLTWRIHRIKWITFEAYISNSKESFWGRTIYWSVYSYSFCNDCVCVCVKQSLLGSA